MILQKKPRLKHLDGYCLYSRYGYEIGINLSNLWHNTQDEDKFIKEFSRTYAHELIHIIIGRNCGKRNKLAEERILFKLLGEHWPRQLTTYYKGNYTSL